MPAETVVRMATIAGARALGLEDEIGSIEIGKRADLAVLDLSRPETVPSFDPYAAVVYSASPASVRHTLVGGEFLKRDGRLVRVDAAVVAARADKEAARWRAHAAGAVR
jgi:5-methylthioadenosine/S-adenosylhomocysteine deaminase